MVPFPKIVAALTAAIAVFRLASAPERAWADEPPREEGVFLTVPNPITSEGTSLLNDRLARAIREKKVKKVVFDFNPDGRDAATPNFYAAADLAKSISQQHQVLTIAFVRANVSRHTVLPVLACNEIVMAADATIGDVRPDKPGPPDEDEVRTYARLAGKAREALVLKMLDPNVVVLEGRRNGGQWYFDGRQRQAAEADGVVAIDPQPVSAAGSVARYTAAEARRFQLCKAVRDTRQEVAELYQLPATSLRGDPLMGRTPNAWVINVHGTVSKALKESVQRKIDGAARRGGNMMFLHLDANGGSYDVARDMAEYLRTLRGPDGLPIVTVAFIPREAADTATFIALGCTEIVMAKEATLGNFRPAQPERRGKQKQPPAEATDLGPIRDSLVHLAKDQGYSPVLFQGLFDIGLEIYRVRSQKGPFERRYLTKADLDADAAGEGRWVNDGLVKAAGQPMDLSAARWKDYGVARHVVENARDTKELATVYGLMADQLHGPSADWLDAVANFFGDPVVAMFLVILGVTCLILELKMPGIGVPGVIAALCFVLFFWSQTQMNGQFALLALMLFLLGLILIGIEVFVVPGFGVCGVSGAVCVLAGLALATVERFPQTSGEWHDLTSTVSAFGLGMAIALVAALMLARYLPHVPYANRMILMPPAERADAAGEPTPAVDHSALLGAVGTAATVLRPAGMARVGDAYIDVVSEGAYIPAGARVQVVEIEGNRVVVKEV